MLLLLAAAYLHAVGLQDEQREPAPDARWARYLELSAEVIYRAAEDWPTWACWTTPAWWR